MKVNFVTESAPGWVLRMLCENWASQIPNSTISDRQADSEADVNFYVNYALFQSSPGLDVALFTHRDIYPPWNQVFDQAAAEVDWCIAMCQKTAAHLPPEKTSVIPFAPDPQFQNGKLVLGVVGTEKQTGRKRYSWLPEIAKIEGVELRCTNGKVAWKDMPAFYRSIDYLLVLSDNEGGPLPLLEALAMKKPVIASDVGFIDQYTTLRYKSLDELIALIRGLLVPENAVNISAQALLEVFEKAGARVP